ncbi:tetratricopeptide repeat protein [Paludisphaera rhizosphaerae]|uniref:tetratricopeptide repeat protein n=1 Tax=Paludisphaera rhizosphaerae TaxID=2711216 RepID=UPI0013EB611C|nr:tetratricopeptide repeat protein [Paludisphaera rhizosphaerae]
MAGRRVLIIGSQNEALGRLSFLPRVAERLHALMTTGPGDCVGVELKDRPAGLLIDPTVDVMKDAIRAAVQQTAAAGDSLVVGYVGHGVFSNGRFYLMPLKSVEPKPGGAVDIARFLGDCLLDHTGGRGVTVLIDACHAGEGVKQAMKDWADGVQQQHAFELLTATDDRVTAGAPLFHTLVKVLERGAPESEAGARLRCRDVYRRLDTEHYPARLVESGADLNLGRNNAKDPGDVFWNWKGSPSSPVILQRTLYFQPTAELRRLVAASEADPVVYLSGAAGTGKSTLASALVRPELTEGAVPEGFVQAIAIINAQTTEVDLARDLEKQLQRTVPGFAGAVDEFQRSGPREDPDYVSLKIVGPLGFLPAGWSVRIVLDGFDQLSEIMRKTVSEALAARPPALRLIVTAHPETPGFPDARRLALESTPADDLEAYLNSRRVPSPARKAILGKSAGQWLVTELLADAVLGDPDIDLARLHDTIEEAYAKRLSQTTGGSAAVWRQRFGPVLSLLAVAGPGPLLPLPLLVHALASLEGPSGKDDVLTVLDVLGGLVVRRDAATPAEHAGLFHATLAEYLLSRSAADAGFHIDIPAAHRAMTAAINALAPRTKRLVDDPLHRYAFLREPHHLWEVGDVDQAYNSLFHRESNIPRENLGRWEEWLARFSESLNSDDRRVLMLRGHIAGWTRRCGDARGALALFEALLLDQERVLGRDHPDVLRTRNNIASLMGSYGNAWGALASFAALLPDQERMLGGDHPDVLTTRNNIAAWTGWCGDAWGALTLFAALLPDRERVLGRDHPDTLTTRGNVAGWTGSCGDARGALALFEALLPDQERVLGRDHPDTLRTRNNIAALTGSCRDARGALALFAALLPDRERMLGRDHPDVLTTRNNIASWTGRCGDARGALALFAALLPDRERVLGRDHPDTLNTLGFVGVYSILTGSEADGCRWLREGLNRSLDRFGPEHQLVRTFQDVIQQYGCGLE